MRSDCEFGSPAFAGTDPAAGADLPRPSGKRNGADAPDWVSLPSTAGTIEGELLAMVPASKTVTQSMLSGPPGEHFDSGEGGRHGWNRCRQFSVIAVCGVNFCPRSDPDRGHGTRSSVGRGDGRNGNGSWADEMGGHLRICEKTAESSARNWSNS